MIAHLTALGLVFFLSAAILTISILGPALRAYRGGAHPVIALSVGITVSALAGWICFFAFVSGPIQGATYQVFTLGLMAYLVWRERDALALREVLEDIVAPIIAAFCIGGVLLLLAFGDADPQTYLTVAATRYTHQLPSDNLIPFVFAEMMRAGELRSPMIGDWLSSDRPPLQTGMVLLYGAPLVAEGSVLVYQVVSTLAQAWALIGVFLLIRALGGRLPVAWAGVALLAASPLFLIHSAFVWPKLLPAGLLCVTATFFTRLLDQAAPSALVGALSGVAAALALGAHGATAFVLVAFAGAALILHRFPSIAFAASGLAAFFASYLPGPFTSAWSIRPATGC